ncbi:MAG: sugar-binding transcriptional regulator [Geminicoccaceae bacterium]
MQPDELSLATRAAWLSYVGNLTQEEIAGRLGVSRIKVARLIGQAVRAGLVHVFVEGAVAECIALEAEIASRWGLDLCIVAPLVDEAPLPLTTLAAAGGHWLHRLLEAGRSEVIGIGHGRTLGAVVNNLPRMGTRPAVRFVSLLGSLTRHAAANPFDVIHRLAEITGAESYFMPAPFFADSLEDKQVLMGQRGLEPVLALARQAELIVLGIGEIGPEAHLRVSGMITPAEHEELLRAGAVGEVLGRFVDAAGRPVAAEINERAVAVRLEELSCRQIVAIAGGRGKAPAIAAVLEGGRLTGLITDEGTARELVAIDRAERPAMSGSIEHVR